MVRTLAIAFLAGLPLFACGCAGSAWAERFGGARRAPAVRPAARTSGPVIEQDGFAVLYFRAIQNEYGVISVVGEIRNVGMAARGVELQAGLRGADGRLVAVGNFCPASYKNIAPGETWPFSYSFGKQQGVTKAEIRIVGAFRTLDTLEAPSTTFRR